MYYCAWLLIFLKTAKYLYVYKEIRHVFGRDIVEGYLLWYNEKMKRTFKNKQG